MCDVISSDVTTSAANEEYLWGSRSYEFEIDGVEFKVEVGDLCYQVYPCDHTMRIFKNGELKYQSDYVKSPWIAVILQGIAKVDVPNHFKRYLDNTDDTARFWISKIPAELTCHFE